jgi:ABC-type dipeptide/oligopeptide/nickel transport system permease subunit
MIGMAFLALMVLACMGTLPWTLGRVPPTAEEASHGAVSGVPRYNEGELRLWGLPPWWWPVRDPGDVRRLNGLAPAEVVSRVAAEHGVTPDAAIQQTEGAIAAQLKREWPTSRHKVWSLLGTDVPNGRSLFVRALAGGGISLGVGIAAALLAVFIGTFYGAISAYAGGVTDAVMMRIVDVLYGLPYMLLVVLLAVAGDALVERLAVARGAAAGAGVGGWLASWVLDHRAAVDVLILLVAIGGVSWLTMARVVRGQVLSLKAQPFMEAARALGVPWGRQFVRHLLPNLIGPVVVYATLTVPQAILQESFLSFLGIGVKPPLPSWGNLAADGLSQLNPYKSYWWLLLFPCVLLALTLLALNFVGEGLREALDPKRARR